MEDRIKKIRKYYKLNQDEFGEKLGVTRSVIANLELNRVEAKPLFINHLCASFNINKKWLETGEGEMISSLPKQDYLNSLGLSEMGKTIIDVFLELPENEQSAIESFLLKLSDKVSTTYKNQKQTIRWVADSGEDFDVELTNQQIDNLLSLEDQAKNLGLD